MSADIYKVIRLKGWVWRSGQPVAIEYETGFSPVDGFPFCREIKSPYIPLSPPPASSREELVRARKSELRGTIEQYRQAIDALTDRLRWMDVTYPDSDLGM